MLHLISFIPSCSSAGPVEPASPTDSGELLFGVITGFIRLWHFWHAIHHGHAHMYSSFITLVMHNYTQIYLLDT
jgi:hypothetical protein